MVSGLRTILNFFVTEGGMGNPVITQERSHSSQPIGGQASFPVYGGGMPTQAEIRRLFKEAHDGTGRWAQPEKNKPPLLIQR